MKGSMRVLAIFAIAAFLISGTDARADERRGLGDLGFDPAKYQSTLKQYPPMARPAAPSSFDWRDYGVVTPSKDQGYCGSCWAFAVTGVIESKIALAGGPLYDLAEQQQVSCNASMSGCCGGNYYALQYWYTNNPLQEACTGYGDYSTGCPTQTGVTCGGISCEEVPYNTASVFTVNANDVDAVKTSLQQDGPAYFRYSVYDDFFDYWSYGAAGAVYTQTSGPYLGGHAILIIGWDDSKQAWLCKNSWGATGGPNDDGAFWMAWSGHTNNLGFGMANVEIVSLGLTQINLFSPTSEATASSAPAFAWTPDGGANNVYVVDLHIPGLVPLWTAPISYVNGWTMPIPVWNVIPSGSYVYWRVRGADLDVTPLNIVTSDEVWRFHKP